MLEKCCLYTFECSSPILQRIYSFHYHISAYVRYSFRDQTAPFAAGLLQDLPTTLAAQSLLRDSTLPRPSAYSTQQELKLKTLIQMCRDMLADPHQAAALPFSLRSRFWFGNRAKASVPPPTDTGPCYYHPSRLPALPRNFGNIDGDINFTSAASTKSVSYCKRLPFSCFSGLLNILKCTQGVPNRSHKFWFLVY